MEELLKKEIAKAFYQCFACEVEDKLSVQRTRKEFKGDYTINVFPWVKQLSKSPDEIARTIGEYLQSNTNIVESFEVIKGFLNIVINSSILLHYALFADTRKKSFKRKILIEFCSPNTNKPLHLGHVRNMLLGDSLSRILLAEGNEVIKLNLVNDRGIHICKSMLAWQKWAKGATPESTNKKGDKFVGDYYVLFEKEYKNQVEQLISEGFSKEDAERKAPLIKEAQELLRKWENGDKDVLSIWQMMNQWVYDGFDSTYKVLDISFDKIYYESETYQLGKKIISEGLSKGILYRKEDGSVWVDLTKEGLDQKLLLRSDGTSVYITQDIATAVLRYREYSPDLMVYVVGNEQIYHFNVLRALLKKLGYHWADNIFHLSYGMVELPEGKMKSREGTVVDADDLIEDLITESKMLSLELGKLKDESQQEFDEGVKKIALAALKYFILKVDPDKNMLFNPKESIDFDGNTGPFILYTYSRIQSLLKKAEEQQIIIVPSTFSTYNEKERELLQLLIDYPTVLTEAAQSYNPSKIANYVYQLAKEFNQYYQQYPVLKEEDTEYRNFRLLLSQKIADIIQKSLMLLGIQAIKRM